MTPDLYQFQSLLKLEFRNDSGEEIPAFGCIRISGTTTINNRAVMIASKPNTYGSQYMHFFNGPTKVASGKYGECFVGPSVPALYDTADGTPAFGERWGPRDATWKLKKNTGGWQVVGNADSSNGVVLVTRAPMLQFTGTCDAAISKNSTGTVSIHYRSSSTGYTDTTVNMSSVLNITCDAASGDRVTCFYEDDGTAAYWKF